MCFVSACLILEQRSKPPKTISKSEAKPKSKPEVKISSSQLKLDSNPEAKPEPKPEPRFEPKLEAKPEPKLEPKLELKLELKPEPKLELKPEPKLELKLELKPEAKPEPKAEIDRKPSPRPSLFDNIKAANPFKSDKSKEPALQSQTQTQSQSQSQQAEAKPKVLEDDLRGWLEVKSDGDATWRRRWCLLSQNALVFKLEKYGSPTGQIDLRMRPKVDRLQQSPKTMFKIGSHSIRAASPEECSSWLYRLGYKDKDEPEN